MSSAACAPGSAYERTQFRVAIGLTAAACKAAACKAAAIVAILSGGAKSPAAAARQKLLIFDIFSAPQTLSFLSRSHSAVTAFGTARAASPSPARVSGRPLPQGPR